MNTLDFYNYGITKPKPLRNSVYKENTSPSGQSFLIVYGSNVDLKQQIGHKSGLTITGQKIDVQTFNFNYEYSLNDASISVGKTPNLCVEFKLNDNKYYAFEFQSKGVDNQSDEAETFKVDFGRQVTINEVLIYHIVEVNGNDNQAPTIQTTQFIDFSTTKIT